MTAQDNDAIFDVAVVGAGAAGQMAAIAAAQGGRRVVLIERMDRAGLKILASGGGHCNIANTLPADQFQARFGRQGRFMSEAMAALGEGALPQLLDRLGIPTIVDGWRVYPASRRAGDVQHALHRRLDELHVTTLLGSPVTGLRIQEGVLRGVVCSGTGVQSSTGVSPVSGMGVPPMQERIEARAVILACGGKSYSSLGGTELGYELARQGGHEIVPPTPALVPLVVRDKWPAKISGVSLPSARVWIDLPRQSKAGLAGEILFTHRGLSGPVVLDISGDVAALLARYPVPIRIELEARADRAVWQGRLERLRQTDGRRAIAGLLAQWLPRSLVETLCKLSGVATETTAAMLPRPGQDALADLLGGAPLTVTGTEGFDAAMVTRGGVKLSQVDPRTLESRMLGGLFFAGELLDLDGPSGGFNLQWAFSSGYLAGTSAAAK
ncbi:MAG: aminoacetone oxidase family FAD-binding enzyme [Planctomycetaceae bacterium]|nr:aminoacetone oxidase family FAD-binding enzyme [Planctomycetaceae bacterium]